MSHGKVGRPKKYPHFISVLDDEVCYTPASIFANAVKCNLLSQSQMKEFRRVRVKVRHTLARMAINYKFPREGDGRVKLPGQCLTIGWTGRRWKSTLSEQEATIARNVVFEMSFR